MGLDLAKMRGLSIEELDKEEHGLREAIWKLRLQRATGQLSDPHKVRRTRQDLARILTIKRELETAKSGSNK